MSNTELNTICQQAIKVTTNVADFIRQELGKVESQDIETKSKNSFVSYVDKQAEMKLVAGLQPILPEASFLTEEETIEQKTSDYRWIIDPLDGTTNFLYGLPHFAISVALQYLDKTVIGIVMEVNRGEVFHAVRGQGAFLNGKPIQVSSVKKMEDAFFSTGFPYYDYKHVDAYLRVIKPLMLNTRGLRRFGAAALDLAYVACGRYDAFFEYSLHPWDVAAGALLVEEAGGQVGDFKGEDNWLFGQEIIASTKGIYQPLLSLIAENFYQIKV